MTLPAAQAHPQACREAQALYARCPLPFPLNVSRLLEAVSTHRVFDVSSHSYNTRFAAGPAEQLAPHKAWTLYNPHLDTYLIVWNAALPTASIRFSVAHELGHILLNHERAWPADRRLGKRCKEREANAFARCLTAPCHAIAALLRGGAYNARLVATHFDIPYSAARAIRADYEACKTRNRDTDF